MPKTLTALHEKCTGCHRCEMWCSLSKENVINPGKARVHVLRREPSLDVALVCLQCGICMNACQSNAIQRNKKSGAVVISMDDCIGCGKCVMACPNGMITIDSVKRKALKCDLCGGDPECVKHCRGHALIFEDVNKVARQRRELYGKSLGKELKGGSATNLNLEK